MRDIQLLLLANQPTHINLTNAMPFSSKRQSKSVLSHWYILMDNFQFSTQEFYVAIEKELTARRAPGLIISKVDFYEGGALSDKRTYLRLTRERLAFDICAAPFGREYFFSLRFVEKPRPGWLALITILAGLIGLYLVKLIMGASFWWVVIVGAIGYLMYWKSRAPLAKDETNQKNADIIFPNRPVPFDIDSFLLNFPVLGEWYEQFRRETYYRHDTRLMYHTLVMEIVKKKVEEVTAAKGVKLIRSYEYSPILGELYKSATVKMGEDPPKS